MILAIIQARLSSTRLPRKALLDIGGKPMLQHVIERVLQVEALDRVALAVPGQEPELVDWFGAQTFGPRCDCASFTRLHPADVLGRFAETVRLYEQRGPRVETVMRITGDCPLWDPVEGARVLAFYQGLHTPLDRRYVWNVSQGYVDGTDTEVFSRDLLLEADRRATIPREREHVTPWMRRCGQVFTVYPTGPRPEVRKTSVDTLDDLERVRALLDVEGYGHAV